MSKVKCKRCEYKPSEHDILEGYCLICAAQIIKAHEALLAENVRLKREHSIVLEDNQRIRENSKPENACRYCGASRITRTSGKWQFYCQCDDPAKRPKKPEPQLNAEKEVAKRIERLLTKAKPEPTEFTAECRKYNFFDAEHPASAKVIGFMNRLREACDRIDRLTAELAKAKNKPEPEKFTEHARHFIPPKTVFDNIKLYESSEQPGYLEKLLHEACDRIDAKDEAIGRLTAEIERHG